MLPIVWSLWEPRISAPEITEAADVTMGVYTTVFVRETGWPPHRKEQIAGVWVERDVDAESVSAALSAQGWELVSSFVWGIYWAYLLRRPK